MSMLKHEAIDLKNAKLARTDPIHRHLPIDLTSCLGTHIGPVKLGDARPI